MDTNKLIFLIDKVLIETNSYVKKYCNADTTSILGTQKVLHVLKKNIEAHPKNIEEEVLRAMHDVGMSSYKEFENTPLEEAINNVTEWLFLNIPEYRKLNSLGIDFERWVNSI